MHRRAPQRITPQATRERWGNFNETSAKVTRLWIICNATRSYWCFSRKSAQLLSSTPLFIFAGADVFSPKKTDPELLRLLWYPERPANTKSPTSCCAAGMLNVFLCSCTRQLLLCYSLKCMSDDWNLINSLRIMILWCIWLCKHLVGSCFFFFLFFCSTLRFSSETVNTYYFASFWSVGY